MKAKTFLILFIIILCSRLQAGAQNAQQVALQDSTDIEIDEDFNTPKSDTLGLLMETLGGLIMYSKDLKASVVTTLQDSTTGPIICHVYLFRTKSDGLLTATFFGDPKRLSGCGTPGHLLVAKLDGRNVIPISYDALYRLVESFDRLRRTHEGVYYDPSVDN